MLDDLKRRDVHDFERGRGRDSTGGVRSRSWRAVQGEEEGGVGREAAGAVMAAESAAALRAGAGWSAGAGLEVFGTRRRVVSVGTLLNVSALRQGI
jgi:hypothetical protein